MSPPLAPSSPSGSPPSSITGGVSPAVPGTPGPPQGQAAPSFLGVRDALKGIGLDLTGRFGDDHQALQHLASSYQQFQQQQQYMPYAQEYMRYAPQFREWLQQQEQARQQQQAQNQSWWKAPEYDPSWVGKVYRDPQSGELRVLPGQDPALISKLQAAIEHRTQFLDKFAFDPIGAIKPGIQELVKEMAQQIVQENMGNYQERSFATSWVAQNSQWLHAKDAQGQLVRDQGGQPQLSQAGQRFAGYVQALDQAGLKNVQVQQALAQKLVEGDIARLVVQQNGQQQSAQAQGDAAKAQFLQQAAQHQPSYGTPANTPAAQPKMKNTNDLFQAMMASFSQAGIKPDAQLIG